VNDLEPRDSHGQGPGREPTETGPMRSLYFAIRQRIIAGLIAALPIAITLFILSYLYTLLDSLVFEPISFVVSFALERAGITGEGLPGWWDRMVAPLINIVAVLVILYVLGLFARSRVHEAIDWVLTRVPVVTTIYKSVRGAFQAVEVQDQAANRFKRVVLVEFPHPGTKVPAFVTRSLRDGRTGEAILCLYVPTTPIPTSGYMLMVPESDVTELDWDLNETLQAVVSGGLTAPAEVSYRGPEPPSPALDPGGER